MQHDRSLRTDVRRNEMDGVLCYTIQQGDTAAYMALRFTGSVQHRHEPWFQIVDPTVPRLIPKAEYGRIHPGWRTCVPETRLTAEWRPATGVHVASRGTAAAIPSVASAPSILIGSGAILLVVVLIAWRAMHA